jgi:hypothetical protein
MTKDFIRIGEFAKLAGTTKWSLYNFRSRGLHGVPEPDLMIGTVLLWRRAKAEAWARRYKERSRR